VKTRGIRLAVILAAVPVLLLWPAPARPGALPEAGTPRFTVAGGYSGYVVPLPDYAARIMAQDDEQHSTASLVYNDISLAPLHIRLGDGYAASAVEVIVHNRSCPVSLPASMAFLGEPSAELLGYISSAGGGEAAPRVSCRLQAAVASGTDSDIYIPVQLYQMPRDAGSAVLQVEVLCNGESVGEEAVELTFLPRGKVYSCLIETEGRGLLEGDELVIADENPGDAWLKYPGFRQEHALVSVAPEDIGPDFRVLRHFAFVIVSAETWSGLDVRARTLLTDAAAMGSRLAVYGAAEPVKVGSAARPPQMGLQFSSFGFGDVAVSADSLASLREHMAELLRVDLRYAYNMALGRQIESVGEASARDLIVRIVLGNLSTVGYPWIGKLAALPQAEGAVNPVWAYSYITRAGLLHPLDIARLHLASRELEQAGTELVERTGTEYPPLHSYLSANLSRSSSLFGLETVLYTLLLLALTAVWFVCRRSYLWLVLAFLILSLGATALFSLRVGVGVPAKSRALVLSVSLASPEAGVAEVRSVAYITSAYASRLGLGISSRGFALGRIAPLDASDISVVVREGSDAAIEGLRVAPMLPLEVGYSEVRAVDAPVSFAWEMLPEGGRKLSLDANEPLSFTFLVDGSRAMYLGRARPGQPRSIILPSVDSPAYINQVRYDAIIARLARQAYSAERRDEARGGGKDELAGLAYAFLSQMLLNEAVRTLVVDGRGTTLLGLRAGERRLSFHDKALLAPVVELFVYRLE